MMGAGLILLLAFARGNRAVVMEIAPTLLLKAQNCKQMSEAMEVMANMNIVMFNYGRGNLLEANVVLLNICRLHCFYMACSFYL